MAKKRLIKFFAILAIFVFLFFPGFSRYQKLLGEERKLKQRIQELEEANRRLEEEKYRLENDIGYIEEKAREKLGIVKKNEIPYKMDK